MIIVNVHEAKSQLSQLLARVEAGEEVIIARAGKPVARLSPAAQPVDRRRFGADRELYEIPDDFDDPLPDQILSHFLS